MNRNELPEHSEYLITEYYKNNIQPFLNAFSKTCLWIGPAEGQMIRNKEALLAAFEKEDNQLTFAMENVQVIPIPVNKTSMDVILTFTITSFYPNGETTVFQQRVELLWAEEVRKDEDGKTIKEYFIRVCHISNEFPYDTRDSIYPNHFTELDIAKIYTGHMQHCRIALKGIQSSYFYLSSDTILWIESKGIHALIHTLNRVYETTESLSDIAAKYEGLLCRVHSSYIVNPMYVSSIGRFYVTMEDGKKISIPEKKYTKTRDEINQMISEINTRRQAHRNS